MQLRIGRARAGQEVIAKLSPEMEIRQVRVIRAGAEAKAFCRRRAEEVAWGWS